MIIMPINETQGFPQSQASPPESVVWRAMIPHCIMNRRKPSWTSKLEQSMRKKCRSISCLVYQGVHRPSRTCQHVYWTSDSAIRQEATA